jgi:type IV secretory pathway VirB2 component (pilin)
MDNYNNDQMQPQAQTYRQKPEEERGLAIASMVLGIVGFVFSCCFALSLPLAVTGLILGIVSLVKGKGGKGMAIAGVILCGASMLVGLLVVIGFAVFASEAGLSWSEYWDEFSREFWDEFNREFEI